MPMINNQNRKAAQGRPAGQPSRPSRGQVPVSRQPQQQQQPVPAKNVKQKKPVTKGTVVSVSIIVSFILLLLFSVGLIFVAMMRTQGETAQYNQMLSDAENAVREASVNVAFSPAQSIREQALGPSANLEVTRGEDGATDNQPQGDAHVSQQADNDGTVSFGAGVIVSQQGETFYILTNNHVVKDASSIKVTVAGTEYKGDLIGADETTDLAVVSIKAKELPVAKLGQSSEVTAGDYTMSIGNPYGLNDSMSSGIVSGLGRDMLYVDGPVQIMYANMIQTDTPVNPGNSGGGLYDAQGKLIGINTLVSGDSSHSDNIGYAIPIDFAAPIAQNLIAGKPGAHASLGLALANVPEDAVAKYGLTSSNGAYVNSVTPSGPAEVAGIVPKDIIIEYDGKPVKDAQDMLYKIRASVINDTKDVKILREGKEMTLSVKVGSDA